MMIGKGARILALALLVGLLTLAVWEMRDFGDPDGDDSERDDNDGKISFYVKENETVVETERTAMDQHFIDNSQTNSTATNNAVTAVVFDYRGFDTLGEATVLFAAVTGTLVAIRKAVGGKEKVSRKGGDLG